jgi:hypothetical protein
MLGAALVAALLAPLGGVVAIRAFEQSTRFICTGKPLGFSLAGATVAIYTIFTWSAGMICCQLSIAKRSIRPMTVALVLNIILAGIRPWTVNDFTTQWIQGVLQGLPVAVISLLVGVALISILILFQLRRERVLRGIRPS